MGRDYFGLINGTIPKFVNDPLPFINMCCDFVGYMPRFKGCGCCVYEYDDFDNYILNTYCDYGGHGNHEEVTYDNSFARWVVPKSRIPEIMEKIKDIESAIPIDEYVYFNRIDHQIYFRNTHNIDTIETDTHYKIFTWIILVSILEAFNRYHINDSVIFTSEC